MTTQEIKRKLTVILSADVKGYSRLMGEDEEWTFRTLTRYKEVTGNLVEQHRGRVVDAPGDNMLAEFTSVVDAVQCGVEIQQVLRAKNALLPESRRMEFRIGINLGDVIEEGHSIYGDGVNIAARLEGLAEAGGICISESAYQQIENKLPLTYKYLGEHKVKNITKPVRVYRAQIEAEAVPEKRISHRQWQMVTAGLVICVAMVAAAVVIWRVYLAPASQTKVASKERVTARQPEKPLMPAPSPTEAVPKEKAPFSPTERDSRLARRLAPTASMKDESVGLVTNLRRDQEQNKAWEETKRKSEEALREVEKLKKEIPKPEGEKTSQEKRAVGTNESTAVDWFDMGLAMYRKNIRSEATMKAFDKAIEITPDYAKAHAMKAALYNEWGRHLKALDESEQAIKLDPNLAWGFSARGHARSALANYQEAIQDFNKAVEIAPRYASPYCGRSWAYFALKDYRQAVEDASRAIELDSAFSLAYFRRGMALASLDKTNQALEDIKRSANMGNNDAQTYLRKKGIQW
jgi:class 3 adenylate cyclase/Tfp pilus assembly protein PilF